MRQTTLGTIKFTILNPKHERFQGEHISGHIKEERVGLFRRRVVYIHEFGSHHFHCEAIDEARQWAAQMDRPETPENPA